ncbi:MAG: N-acetylmuramoyl-L-alanine amidase [candidate division WOR-3 bacterium]
MMVFFILASLSPKYEIICDTNRVTVQSIQMELKDFVPLKSVAEVCGINFVFDTRSQRLYLSTAEHQMVLIPDIGTIQCDGLYENIAFAPRFYNGDVYFVVQAIIPVLSRVFEKLIFIKEIREIPEIDDIKIITRGDSTVIKFTWEMPIEFDVQFFPQTAVVEIDGRYKKKDKIRPVGQIKNVKLDCFNTYTSLKIDLMDINSYQERESEVVFFKKTFKQINTIVLDPGHGGIDPGAIGRGGLYEKDINLAITRLLKEIIEDSLGIKVLLTRTNDIYLSLRARTQFANRNNGDVFLSIHCNASPRNRKASGFETYFLSEAKTDEARAVAAMENASLKFDEDIVPKDEINFILYDLAQSAFLEESNYLAECIQTSAERILSIPARSVNQAGFYVLKGAFMPAVLIECAFISNPEEEKWLRDKKNQQKLAYTIFCGVKEYIENYERRLNN